MKKIGFLISIILCFHYAFAQHEGIERHFNSYKFTLAEETDLSLYSDTLTDNFHNFFPQQKMSLNNLGYMNPGHPMMTAVYSQQPRENVFWFFNYYYPYIKNHDDVIYFDTRKPFTIFKFNGGGKGLENVKFVHSQNIGSSFNFAFDYDVINSEGYYMFNSSKVHALSFSGAYTKHKYQFHFNFIFNRLDHNENGGIQNYSDFENTDVRTENIPVNLSSAKNRMSQLGFQYNHEYRFGTYLIDTVYQETDTVITKSVKSNFSIMHDVKYDRYYKLYTDNAPGSFYDDYFFTPGSTLDSTGLQYLDNKLLLKFNLKNTGKISNFQILAGVKNISYLYSYSLTRRSFSSNYLTGFLQMETPRGFLNGELSYGLTGREAFDLIAKANYKQEISEILNFDAYFDFGLTTPSVFLHYFKSNNFRWRNEDLAKVNKTSASIDFNFKKWGFNLGANINIMHNYFVFDTTAYPKQISSANLIADVYLKKLFNFGNFHWFNQLTYQYISDRENLPLPAFVAYSDFYFKRPLFRNAITVQLGIDARFHTNIYGYSYMPATGVFYLQDTKEFGNYPNASVYAAFKIKRFRAFVKAGNLTSFVMPRTFYLLNRIPDNPFSFNFGISWEFYD